MSAPNATERKACWNSKDKLWKCLDDNGDKAEHCHKYQSEFEANCPAQWVNCPVQQSTQAVIQTEKMEEEKQRLPLAGVFND